MAITTNSFKVSGGEYVEILFKLFVGRWWWIGAIAVIGVFSLSAININFIYVALMLIFIVIPMIMAFLYIYYGLVPESRLSILEKSAIISSDAIELHFEKEDGIVKIEHLNFNSFTRYVPKKKCLLLVYRGRNYRFLVIPYTAFKCADDLQKSVIAMRKAGLH